LGPSAFYKWYLFEIYIYLFVRNILIFHIGRKMRTKVRQISKNALMFEEEKKLLEHEKSEPSDF
jgi:hypothetical protein